MEKINKKWATIAGVIIVLIALLIGYGTYAGYIFQPKQISFVSASKKPRERIWLAGNLSESGGGITGKTTVENITVTKNGKQITYDLLGEDLSEIQKKSNSEIIKLAKSDDKTAKKNIFEYKINEAKNQVEQAKQNVQQASDDEKSNDTINKNMTSIRLADAKSAYKEAQKSYNDATESYQDDKQYISDKKEAINNAKKDLDKAQKDYDKTQSKSSSVDTGELDDAQNRLKSLQSKKFKYEAPKPVKVKATGESDGKYLTKENGADMVTSGAINGTHYAGYAYSNSDNVLFTKMANDKQSVVFDKPKDVTVEN